MDNYFVFITLSSSVIALLFAIIMARYILRFSAGNEKMRKISAAIKSGANAYLKRQYTVVAVFFAVMLVILSVMAIFGMLTVFVPFAFLSGGVFSALSGFVGMKIATAATGKGFAIGSAALTALALLASYVNKVQHFLNCIYVSKSGALCSAFKITVIVNFSSLIDRKSH